MVVGLASAGGGVFLFAGLFVWYRSKRGRRNWWEDDKNDVPVVAGQAADPFRLAVDKYHQAYKC